MEPHVPLAPCLVELISLQCLSFGPILGLLQTLSVILIKASCSFIHREQLSQTSLAPVECSSSLLQDGHDLFIWDDQCLLHQSKQHLKQLSASSQAVPLQLCNICQNCPLQAPKGRLGCTPEHILRLILHYKPQSWLELILVDSLLQLPSPALALETDSLNVFQVCDGQEHWLLHLN